MIIIFRHKIKDGSTYYCYTQIGISKPNLKFVDFNIDNHPVWIFVEIISNGEINLWDNNNNKTSNINNLPTYEELISI